MTVELVRLDDRLVHGQVVVGWGQALAISLVVLVDDKVRESEWEQELYRMSMPPDMDVEFVSVAEAILGVASWSASARKTLLLTGSVDSLVQLVDGARLRRVNIGGVHQHADRRQRLRYVFLSEAEAAQLAALSARGVDVSAQDVPSARPVPWSEMP